MKISQNIKATEQLGRFLNLFIKLLLTRFNLSKSLPFRNFKSNAYTLKKLKLVTTNTDFFNFKCSCRY